MVRPAGWTRWRPHVGLLAFGLLAGVALSIWDFACPTVCKGSLPCIDYTGVATAVYWAIFAAQALLTTAGMAIGARARVRFFRVHVASAAAITACAVIGWIGWLAP